MNGSRPLRRAASRAAITITLTGALLGLGGCNALEGALIGSWFGAILGQSGEAAVAGAAIGAGVGAVIGANTDCGYTYQDYYCPQPARGGPNCW